MSKETCRASAEVQRKVTVTLMSEKWFIRGESEQNRAVHVGHVWLAAMK